MNSDNQNPDNKQSETKQSETMQFETMQSETMQEKTEESGIDKLVNGYDTLMDQLVVWTEKADKNAGPLLINGMHDAEKFLHDLGKWTEEEVDLLSRYIKRDIHDISLNLEKSNKSLHEWLQFDGSEVEAKLLDVLSTMTDKTRLELDKISHLAEEKHSWHTGEVTSIGTLTCSACGKQLHFHKVGRIPPCPKCHKTSFER
jgi:predicted Zn-ribbon and HTH transcriptional regulator